MLYILEQFRGEELINSYYEDSLLNVIYRKLDMIAQMEPNDELIISEMNEKFTENRIINRLTKYSKRRK